MTRDESIIELGAWLESAPGRYLLDWEARRLDEAVVDAFGFHALQLGLPEFEALRANRMPHRWVCCVGPATAGAALCCDFDALPFPQHSIDLVVLPHTLELARDPHQTLREVERVLVPEGRLVITGFNPASLWGLRQRAGRMRQGMGIARARALYLPRAGEFIGYWRLRDWLRLLGFEVEGGRFGCYAPPFESARWIERFGWMDRVGERWWPVLGSVYFIAAVKRVRGMRLVGLVRNERRKAKSANAVVANREPAEQES